MTDNTRKMVKCRPAVDTPIQGVLVDKTAPHDNNTAHTGDRSQTAGCGNYLYIGLADLYKQHNATNSIQLAPQSIVLPADIQPHTGTLVDAPVLIFNKSDNKRVLVWRGQPLPINRFNKPICISFEYQEHAYRIRCTVSDVFDIWSDDRTELFQRIELRLLSQEVERVVYDDNTRLIEGDA